MIHVDYEGCNNCRLFCFIYMKPGKPCLLPSYPYESQKKAIYCSNKCIAYFFQMTDDQKTQRWENIKNVAISINVIAF